MTARGRPTSTAVAQSDQPSSVAERQVTISEARVQLSRLLRELEAGSAVVITRRGKPVAKLEAIRSRPKRVFGSMKGLISIDERFFEPLPDDELELWGEI